MIDDCDYYMVIVGGRYGSTRENGVSYTEMEYRYAVERGKPVIGFLHKAPGDLPAKKSEKSEKGRKALEAFRGLVAEKTCQFWTGPADLGSRASRSLVKLMKAHPAIGWVRADALPDKDTSTELLDLRKRVDELQRELDQATTQAPEGSDVFAQGDDSHVVHYSFQARNQLFDSQDWTGHLTTTWNQVFSAISPLLIDEAPEPAIAKALGSFVRGQEIEELCSDDDMKGKTLSGFMIQEDDFQTIKVQLRALGLIAKSMRQRSVKDTESYWTLTPYGDTQMVRLRAIQRATSKPKKAPPPSTRKAK